MRGQESLSVSTSKKDTRHPGSVGPHARVPYTVDLTGIAPGSGGGVESVAVGVVQGLLDMGSVPRCLVAEDSQEHWIKVFSTAAPEFFEVGSVWRAGSAWQRALRNILPSKLKTSSLVGMVRRLRGRSVERAAQSGVIWFPFHRSSVRAHSAAVTVHDLRVFEPSLASAMDQSIIRRNIQNAKAVICSWAHPYEHLIELFPEAAHKIFKISLPVLNPGPAIVSRPLAKDSIRLILPASVTPHKNHELVLRALAERENFYLTCTGVEVEPFASELKQLADELGVADRVRWLGYVGTADLEAEYQQADLLVMPSRWEAASGPVFEAVVRELPFIASSIPPISAQLLDLGLDAPTFDCDSVPEVVRALDEAIRDYPKYKAQLSVPAARLRSRRWRDTADEYRQVFEWMEGRAAKPTHLQKEAKQ